MYVPAVSRVKVFTDWCAAVESVFVERLEQVSVESVSHRTVVLLCAFAAWSCGSEEQRSSGPNNSGGGGASSDGTAATSGEGSSLAGASGSAGGGGVASAGAGGTFGKSLDCSKTLFRSDEPHRFGPSEAFSTSILDMQTRYDGTAALLWRDSPEVSGAGQPAIVWFAQHSTAGTWSDVERVYTSNEGSVVARLAVVDRSARTFVLLAERSGSASTLKGAVRDNAGAWSATSPVVELIPQESRFSAVVDERGAATAVWVGGEEGAEWAYAARLSPDSDQWSAPVTLSAAQSSYLDEPQLELLPNGDVVVLWSQGQTGGFTTWVNLYDESSATWTGPKQLSADGEYRPDLSTWNGTTLGVWAESYPDKPDAVFHSWFDGMSWSAPLKLHETANEPDDLASAVSDDGSALVMWQEDGPEQQLFYAAFDASSASWSTPTVLDYPGRTRPEHVRVTWIGCERSYLAQWRHYDEEGEFMAWYVPGAGFSAVSERRPVSMADPWGKRLHAKVDTQRRELVAEWFTTR